MNKIGILGGSGFYNFLENTREIEMDTPYGKPSCKIMIGEHKGKEVVFLPRHGAGHKHTPHKIPYRANLWAFKELGVKFILGPCASGSLKPNIKPGDFVICDQFVDRTRCREDTYYDGPKVGHLECAEPYCSYLGELAANEAKKLGITAHHGGTVVVIEGPRFSTKAESKWFSASGFDVVNMTQYPECVLARELEMCYAGINLITDYDVGLSDYPEIKPVTIEEVLKTFNENNEKIRNLLFTIIEKIDVNKTCTCHSAMAKAFLN